MLLADNFIEKLEKLSKMGAPPKSGKLQDRTTPEYRKRWRSVADMPNPPSYLMLMGEALLPEHLRGCLLTERHRDISLQRAAEIEAGYRFLVRFGPTLLKTIQEADPERSDVLIGRPVKDEADFLEMLKPIEEVNGNSRSIEK